MSISPGKQVTSFVGEIVKTTSSPNPGTLSTKTLEKEESLLLNKPECHALHRQSAKRLQRQKETSPFYIDKQIQPITYMLSRQIVTSPQVRGLIVSLSHIGYPTFTW